MSSEMEQRIIGAEVPPQQEMRRGRTFMLVYVALLVLAVIAFVVLAVLVHAQGVLGFDVPITLALQHVHLPLYGWVLTHVSDLGYHPGDIIAYVVVFVVFFALRLRLEAVLGVASALLAGAAGNGIKLVVARMRPSAHSVHVAANLNGYSFPSGHVIEYTTLFGFAFYVLWVAWPSGWARNLILAVLALLVLLVGPSRVYLGEHFPSDVVGAYLFASLWLAGTIELHLMLKRRFAARPGPGAARGESRSARPSSARATNRGAPPAPADPDQTVHTTGGQP